VATIPLLDVFYLDSLAPKPIKTSVEIPDIILKKTSSTHYHYHSKQPTIVYSKRLESARGPLFESARLVHNTTYATSNGRAEVVKILLGQDDVYPDKPDNYSRTPLRLAASNGQKGVVNVLLQRGVVRPNKLHNDGRMPLVCCREWAPWSDQNPSRKGRRRPQQTRRVRSDTTWTGYSAVVALFHFFVLLWFLFFLFFHQVGVQTRIFFF